MPIAHALVAPLVATKHTLTGLPEVGLWLYASTVAALCGLFFVRKNKVEAAAHWEGFTLLWAIFGSAAFDEPGQAPIVPILVLLVLVTTLVGGFRVGLTWGATSIAALLAAFVLNQQGVVSEWLVAVEPRQVVEASATIAFTLLVLLAYERNKDAMHRSISEARDRADAAHREAMTILNNVEEGFFNLNPAGEVTGQWSLAFERWMGKVEKGQPVWELFRQKFPKAADCLEAGWMNLEIGLLPIAVSIDTLPTRAEHDGRYFRLTYHPTAQGEQLEGVVCVMSDISSDVLHHEAELEMGDMFSVFRKMLDDMDGVRQFFEDGDTLLIALQKNAEDRPNQLRTLHTLKGSAAVIGLSGLADECHRLESQLDEQASHDKRDLERLRELWERSKRTLGVFLPDAPASHISLEYAAYARHRQHLMAGTPHCELLSEISNWPLQPTSIPLMRLAEQANALAARLNKSPIEVTIDDGGVRQEYQSWSALWASMGHVVRNAVDHGIESSEERIRAGKSARGHICLATRIEGESTVIEIADDGRGVSWEKLRARATAAGVGPDVTDGELLFWPGLSSTESVTAVSGRGVGADAVREACRAMGGTVDVVSELGKGTTFRCVVPKQASTTAPLAMTA